MRKETLFYVLDKKFMCQSFNCISAHGIAYIDTQRGKRNKVKNARTTVEFWTRQCAY